MKYITPLYVLFVLFSLLGLPYAHAQNCANDCVNEQADCEQTSTGYSLECYDCEIEKRSLTVEAALGNINIDLVTTNPGTDNETKNYVILNDRDFYDGCGTGCKWPYIDAKYGNGTTIDDITYFILTPGDYRDYLTFKPRFDNVSDGDTDDPNTNPGTSSIDDTKYLLYYPGSSSDDEDDIESYLKGTSGIPLKPASEQAEHERAIIENFSFSDNSWSWVVRGITIRGNHNSRFDDRNGVYGSGSSTSSIQSDDNIIKDCLLKIRLQVILSTL